MSQAIFLILLPLVVFGILLIFGSSLKKAHVALLGFLGILCSAIYAFFLFGQSFSFGAERQVLWTLVPDTALGFLPIECALYVDALALTMCMVVTFISFLIALYSTEYMADSEGYCRFFALINLFVAFMLILVLADNLWVLFIGWEGVGVSSYLLIGYYFKERGAEMAAMKAFLITRVGDVFLLFGMFGCATTFHSLQLQKIIGIALNTYPQGSLTITLIAFCLLLGAVGKSAQLPLQTWLPDAMWGPTPVSALIHAATMVTAGVYLLARMWQFIALSVEVETAVFFIGAITMILGAMCAIVQTDLKRVLAYSTMSQIGYMFFALGISAPKAAIFHLVTHAFFKALLFLSAGVIGHEIHHYDLTKMGGLRKSLPLIFALFLFGCLNSVGLPLVTAGFFSKEWILSQAWQRNGFQIAYMVGVFGAVLTAIYNTRMIILAFFGESTKKIKSHSGPRMIVPLFILAFFALTIGWLEVPHAIASITLFSNFLASSLPEVQSNLHEPVWVLIVPSLATLVGILLAIWRYGDVAQYLSRLQKAPGVFTAVMRNGAGFNWLYATLIVKPYVYLCRNLASDVADGMVMKITHVFNGFLRLILSLHTEKLSHYVSFFVVAALTLASVMVLS